MTAVTVSPAAWLGLLSSARGHERAEALADALPDGSSIRFLDTSNTVLRTVTTGAWTVGEAGGGSRPVVPGALTDPLTGAGTPDRVEVRDDEGHLILSMPAGVGPGEGLRLYTAIAAGVPIRLEGFSVGVLAGDDPPEPPAELEFSGVPATLTIQAGRSHALAQYVTGGVPPLTFGASGLPAGVSIDPETGLLSADPEADEGTTSGVMLTVADAAEGSDTATVSIEIVAPSVIVELDARVTVRNRGDAASNVPVRRVVPFRQGQIPSGQFPVARMGGSPIAAQQFNIQSRHPDGSVKHGIFNALLPTVAASASSDITWAPGANPNGASISKAAVVAALGDTSLTITDGANPLITRTWHVGDLLDAATLGEDMRGSFEWINGALCACFIVRDRAGTSLDLTGPEGQILTTMFEVWHWSALSATLCCIRVENSKLGGTGNWFGYSVSITDAAGAEVYAHPGMPHQGSAAWRKRLWVQGVDPFPSTLDAKYDNEWLSSIGANFRYDPDHEVPLNGGSTGKYASINQVLNRWAAVDKDAFEQGLYVYRDMGTASIITTLGPYPGWDIVALMSGRRDVEDAAIANADLGCSWASWLIETEDPTDTPTATGSARTRRYWHNMAQDRPGKGWPVCTYGRPTLALDEELSIGRPSGDSVDRFTYIESDWTLSDPTIGSGRTLTSTVADFSPGRVGQIITRGSGTSQSRATIVAVNSAYEAIVDISNNDFPSATLIRTQYTNPGQWSSAKASHLQNLFTWPFVWTGEFHYLDAMMAHISLQPLRTSIASRSVDEQYRRPNLPVSNGIRAEFRPHLMIWDLAWWSPDGSPMKTFAEDLGIDTLVYSEGKRKIIRDGNNLTTQWQFADSTTGGDLPDNKFEPYVIAENRPSRTWQNLNVWGGPYAPDSYVLSPGSSGYGYWPLAYGALGYMNGFMKGYPTGEAAKFLGENFWKFVLDPGANPKCLAGYTIPATTAATRDFYPTVAAAMADYNHDMVEAQWPNGYNDYKPMAIAALGALGEMASGGYAGEDAYSVFTGLTGPYRTNNWDCCWRIVPRGT